MEKKKTIALVAGGDSGESVVSLNSAAVIEKEINREKYHVYTIHISKKGWIAKLPTGDVIVDKNDFSIIQGDKKITFDAVFIVIHGTPGEDGKLQGYFDLLNIPYTSCDLTTSAITFNKGYCKKIVEGLGAHTAKSVHLFKSQGISLSAITEKLTLPFFVKPNNGGSSIGMSKVNNSSEIQAAIDKAFNEDEEILIEEFIQGRELTCGVISIKGEITVFPITEIISKKDFFDYEAKYSGTLADEVTPAQVPEEITQKVKETSAFLYKGLNCKGMVRFDFIIKDNSPYFLEVNTVPGLSANSIIPQQARAAGISAGELYELAIEEALAR